MPAWADTCQEIAEDDDVKLLASFQIESLAVEQTMRATLDVHNANHVPASAVHLSKSDRSRWRSQFTLRMPGKGGEGKQLTSRSSRRTKRPYSRPEGTKRRLVLALLRIHGLGASLHLLIIALANLLQNLVHLAAPMTGSH
jgi:hypothetical protein